MRQVEVSQKEVRSDERTRVSEEKIEMRKEETRRRLRKDWKGWRHLEEREGG